MTAEAAPPTPPPASAPDGSVGLAQTLAYARELHAVYEAAKARAARLRLLVEVDKELISARDLEALLRLALDRSLAFSSSGEGRVLLCEEPSGRLRVAATTRPPTSADTSDAPETPRGAAGRGRTPAERALAAGRPLVVEEADERGVPRWRTCLPLVTPAGRALGVLELTRVRQRQTRPLEEEDLEALHLLATQVAAAVENVRLREQLTARERQLQDLVGRLLLAQEEERRRVAYDLHDSLAQVAAGAHQHLQAFAGQYRPRSPRAREALDRSLDLAQRTVREARRAIANLRPTALDDFGLAVALRLEAEALRAEGWQLRYDESVGAERLPQAVETALYRAAQEALQNVRKHAGTRAARVTLRRTRRGVRLEVRDAGRGFDATAPSTQAGPGERVGLEGMRERAALLGGRCIVRSRPGRGTLVQVEVPLERPRTSRTSRGASAGEGSGGVVTV